MTWNPYIVDTMSGQLVCPIDIPSFSWSVSVSDCTLSTTKDKGTGETEVSGLTLPWSSIPGATVSDKAGLLTQDKRSIVLFWKTSLDPEDLGTPILFGAIGTRSDSWLDTSFSLNSMLELLDSRYCVREGVYGKAADGTSKDTIKFTKMSLRGIASEVGYLCTNAKHGGGLPIDWQYRGETGSHERTYEAWDIQNISCKEIFTKLSNVIGGPDMQFRPYLADDSHVRLKFEAGSDADIYLGQTIVHRLYCRPYGGDIESLTVDHLGPIQRVYASGSGTEEAQLTAYSEDMTLCSIADSWPLREMTYSDSDTDNLAVLKSHCAASLAANKTPLMQFRATLNVNDSTGGYPLHPLGSFWPGEVMEIALDGFPCLPDDVYSCRLMQMSGNESATVELVFDVMADPIT